MAKRCSSDRRPERLASALALVGWATAPGASVYAQTPPGAEPLAAVPEVSGSAPRQEGTFLDVDGRWRDFSADYDAWIAKPRGPERYELAALEELLLILGGTAYYWLRTDINRKDWDRPSLVDRLTFEAVRFDNNETLTNHVIHPFAGASYYAFARVNNLSVPVALAYGFTSSLVWEYIFEWRELVSINDQVFTGIGGVAMGEFFFQLGEYMTSIPHRRRVFPTAGAFSFGLPRTVHTALFDDAAPRDDRQDSRGLSRVFWHRFGLSPEFVSVVGAGQRQRLAGLAAHGELVAMPGFGRPGHFGRAFSHGNFTEAHVELAIGESWTTDLDLWFAANLAGYYRQDFDAWGAEHAAGHAKLIALSTAFRYSDHRFSDRGDQVAVSHILGPWLGWWWKRGAFGLRADANAHLDFAAIRSLAFEEWRLTHDPSGVKTVLSEKNYQFHLGGSFRGRFALAWHGIELGAGGGFGSYGSIEGLDRFEERVTDDLHGKERVFEYDFFFGLPVPRTPLRLRLGLDTLGRESRIADVKVRRVDVRASTALGVWF